MTRIYPYNAQGGEYQSAMPHEGQFARRRMSDTAFRLTVFAYCVFITSLGIGLSLYFTEPPASAATPPAAVSPASGAVEAGAAGYRGGR